MCNPLDNPDYVGPTARLASIKESLDRIAEEVERLRNHDTGKSDDLEILAALASIYEEDWARAVVKPFVRNTEVSRLAGITDGVHDSAYLLGGAIYNF